MSTMANWGLERRHLLVLFIAGVASRGFIKSLLGVNASIALLLGVALYYLYMKRQSESVYDEIARQQVKAAAKLDAIHELGDGKLSDAERLATRQTHFQLSEAERMVITDRIHQYSNKMSGSHKDRRKFLAASRKRLNETEAAALADGKPAATETKNGADATALEKIVEQAVDETL